MQKTSITTIKDKLALLLSQIVGKPVTIEIAPTAAVATFTPGLVATYETGTGEIAAIWVSDLELVANAGAALCMIPPYVAQESIKAKKILEPFLSENYQEVLNICARLFSDSPDSRVRLRSVEFSEKCEPSKLIPNAACAQREVRLNIVGYGRGRMWVCA
jgi:hypothetical protein